MQLERVRLQLADALFPMSNNLGMAQLLQSNLWELKLPINKTLLQHKSFVRPLSLFPHLEVGGASSPELMRVWSGTPLQV